ncbi:MAG TPA: tellurite resistance/C4-dicarboxylate transporter family protein [Nevskiaceae bacterium]|nr:tellurite resistance/C4-dicarboxylate transporter family protein [Nevskiaceae bacterium]
MKALVRAPSRGLSRRLYAATKTLSPGYYSMVMATGILSIAALLLGVPLLPQILFALNWVFFAAICVLAVLRVLWHLPRVLADLGDHIQAFGFFTFVAACSVLASETLLVGGDRRVAVALGVAAAIAWVGLTYIVFGVITVKPRKPRLSRGINGGWLLAVVATQALAILGAQLAPQAALGVRLPLNFFALALWLFGGMLYIWLMSLIFYRYTFFVFSPADLSPPYWINMGAMAISTLAGALLIDGASQSALLASMLPFIKGFTVFYWATGTWWIPMLILLAVWRHAVRRFPFRYDPMYWGAIFPVGMYAAATERLLTVLHLSFLQVLPEVMLGLGIIAWLLLFGGQLGAAYRGLTAPEVRCDVA